MNRVSLSFKNQLITSIAEVQDSKFRLLSLEPGQGLTKHQAPHFLNLIVLTGRIRFSVENEEALLEASEMVMVDPKKEHEIEAIEKSTVLLILVPQAQQPEAGQKRTLDHENAFMNPGLIENVAPELRPLVEDHIEICRLLETIKETFKKEDVTKVLEVVSKELNSHFVAEEELLFPRMAQHVGGLDVGPVARLIEEHKKIRRLHGEASELFNQVGDAPASTALKEKLTEMSFALLNHLGKEDSHLFPMASRLLTADEKTTIAEGLKRYL